MAEATAHGAECEPGAGASRTGRAGLAWPGSHSWSSACQAGVGQSRYLLGARERAAKRPSQTRL